VYVLNVHVPSHHPPHLALWNGLGMIPIRFQSISLELGGMGWGDPFGSLGPTKFRKGNRGEKERYNALSCLPTSLVWGEVHAGLLASRKVYVAQSKAGATSRIKERGKGQGKGIKGPGWPSRHGESSKGPAHMGWGGEGKHQEKGWV
jgi:hypothetical protein